MKTLPELVVLVLSDVKLLMCHHLDESTKLSGSSALVPVKLPSEISRLLPNVYLMNLSMPLR